MKPTIEQVIKKYENVEKVKAIYTNDILIIDWNKGFHISVLKNINFYDIYGTERTIWLDGKGFAEIISYKTPKLEIDKDLILKIADKCPSCKDDLKKEFPSVFEDEIEWIENNWYWCFIRDCKYLVLADKGVLNGKAWICDSYTYALGRFDRVEAKATSSEILSALQKEAEKIGFVKGCKYKHLKNGVIKTFIGIEELRFYPDGNYLTDGNGGSIFNNGTWATPIQTVTQKELLDHYKESKGITNEIIVEG